ncbi:histone deacetylase HDT1-like [Hibiscus syriacus]|uniref:histone deacetylase HDT1-like n=1 Tax=Hibiscus syriacus TaxID=106335 RepID=UPI0019248174|nr:histone deacetylase HDT1-like [Hibiscus syriacus]
METKSVEDQVQDVNTISKGKIVDVDDKIVTAEQKKTTCASGRKTSLKKSKNRPVKTATPASKKAKFTVLPQKSVDGKKGGHITTPHPGKQARKYSAKTPKSGGLGSHKKAKHGGK